MTKSLMKWFAFCAIALTSNAFAGPFVVSDPLASGTTSCGVFLDAAGKVTIAVVPATAPAVGNICKFDVSGVSTGSHTIQMTAIAVNDPVWGSQESAKSSPLVFVRPGTPAAPTGLLLTP